MPKFEIPRSNPIGDFLHGDGHPFPERIEEIVRMIAAIDEEHLLPFMNISNLLAEGLPRKEDDGLTTFHG